MGIILKLRSNFMKCHNLCATFFILLNAFSQKKKHVPTEKKRNEDVLCSIKHLVRHTEFIFGGIKQMKVSRYLSHCFQSCLTYINVRKNEWLNY
jgi:hypothetical protein